MEGKTKTTAAEDKKRYPVPNFIVLGVGKTGTTSIYHYLRQHPEVYLSPIKETNYFASDAIDFDSLRPDMKASRHLDVGAYVEGDMDKIIFGANVRKRSHYAKLFKNVTDEKAIGEVCPNYFSIPASFDKMKKEIPDAKMVAILRNPIDRAYSSYIMHYREGREAREDFLEAVREDHYREEKGWGINFGYLDGGLYAQKLRKLYTNFPAEKVKVYLYEDLKEDKELFFKDLLTFLGVNPQFELDVSERYNVAANPRFPALNRFLVRHGVREWARRKLPPKLKTWVLRLNYTSDRSRIPNMDEKTKKWLSGFFQSDIEKTSRILNRDLTHWLE